MRPNYYIEYHNTNLRKLNSLQRLLFTYVLGCLGLEDSSMVGKDAGFIVSQVDTYNVTIQFKEINPKLINGYLKDFPLRDMVKDYFTLKDDTLYINDMVMNIRTKPVLTFDPPTL